LIIPVPTLLNFSQATLAIAPQGVKEWPMAGECRKELEKLLSHGWTRINTDEERGIF
jgi:hypothetical protein